jgi:hypothetical protein
MKPLELNCKNLGSLNDGRAAEIIVAALAELAKDVRERGDEAKARTLKIELDLAPLPGEQVGVTVRVSSKRPGLRTATHNGRLRTLRDRTQIVFVPDNPGDGSRPTLTPDEE